jgi:acyl dehydratase
MTAPSIRDLEHRVGQEVGVSPWVEVSQERIDTFAKAINDFQWIHVDPVRAKSSPFGGTIAHGFLTLSLLSHLSERTFGFSDRKMGVNYGLNRVRFTAPVPVGSKLRARIKLLKVDRLDPLPKSPELVGAQSTWEVTIEREGSDRPVCVAESISRRYG